MKCYLLKDEDFEKIRLILSLRPSKLVGYVSDTEEGKKMFEEIHRLFVYHIEGWISDVTK